MIGSPGENFLDIGTSHVLFEFHQFDRSDKHTELASRLLIESTS